MADTVRRRALAHHRVQDRAEKAAVAGDVDVATSAVRMSFTTPRPFFPYREPEDQRTHVTGARTLDVHVIALGRVDGAIGDERRLWPGVLLYARPRKDLESLLAGVLPGGVDLASAWLNSFRDASSPRPGTDDLIFAPAIAREEVVPPPIVLPSPDRVVIPVDLVALALVTLYFAARIASGSGGRNPQSK